jgi:hypothetical protein
VAAFTPSTDQPLLPDGETSVVGSSYWNLGVGSSAVLDDDEGISTMRRLGENMAWVMERLARP